MHHCSLHVTRPLTTVAGHAHSGICGPAVKLLAIQYGIALDKIKGSGPKSNILKSDILSHIKTNSLKPVPIKASPVPVPKESKSKDNFVNKPVGSKRNVEKFVDIPLSNIRSTIAKRLSTSKQTIPHEYQSIDIRGDALANLRRNLKENGIVVSLNDFIIKATGLALKAVPEINVIYEGDSARFLPNIDISIAVATPTGLITPIVKNADILGVCDISHRVKELAGRAREGKLQPQEFQGGSFTISNLGMFGSVSNFTAIINPPQAAILTVGGNRLELDSDLKPETRFTVTLCFDGRAIDEQSAARFLAHLSASLSDPDFMAIEPLDPALDFDFARLL